MAADLPQLPPWDDAELVAAIAATEHLTDAERREFLASLYRAVLGWERTGDARLLTQFAREARTTVELWSRPDFRDSARRPSSPIPPEETLTVHDMLAKLGR